MRAMTDRVAGSFLSGCLACVLSAGPVALADGCVVMEVTWSVWLANEILLLSRLRQSGLLLGART